MADEAGEFVTVCRGFWMRFTLVGLMACLAAMRQDVRCIVRPRSVDPKRDISRTLCHGGRRRLSRL